MQPSRRLPPPFWRPVDQCCSSYCPADETTVDHCFESPWHDEPHLESWHAAGRLCCLSTSSFAYTLSLGAGRSVWVPSRQFAIGCACSMPDGRVPGDQGRMGPFLPLPTCARVALCVASRGHTCSRRSRRRSILRKRHRSQDRILR